MFLKILYGQNLNDEIFKNEKGTFFLERPNIKLQASKDNCIDLKINNKEILLIGDISGIRNASNLLNKIDNSKEIIKKYIKENDNWIDFLEGRFLAITFFNEKVIIQGDKYTKIDLFYKENPTGGILSTSISDIISIYEQNEIDQESLVHLLTYYGHRPPKKHTLYKEIKRIGVGEKITLFQNELKVEKGKFTPSSIKNYDKNDLNRYADTFLSYLEACGSSEGNIVYLSSGWDSTSILAGLVHVFGKSKVRAITGKMTYSKRSGVCNKFEMERANAFAEYYGIRLDIADFDYENHAPKYIEMATPLFKDKHFFSFTGLNHLILTLKAKQIVNGENEVIFAGEISDGAHNFGFSQYATIFHPSYDFREYADKMASYLFGPTFFDEVLAGRIEKDAVYQFMKMKSGNIVFDEPAKDKSDLAVQFISSFFLRNGRIPFWSLQNQPLLKKQATTQYTKTMASCYFADAHTANSNELYSWYLHLYNSFHWQGSTVATLQTMAEHFGLRAHLPFWDTGLQNWLSSMPESFGRGLDLNNTKYPLKWMLENRLDYPMHFQKGPHSYTYDVNHSFNHTEELMYHSSLTPLAQKKLQTKPYRETLSEEYFDLYYIDELVKKYINNEKVIGTDLNNLVSIYLLSQTLYDT